LGPREEGRGIGINKKESGRERDREKIFKRAEKGESAPQTKTETC